MSEEREYWIFKIRKPRPKIRKKIKKFLVVNSPLLLTIIIIILGILADRENILTEVGGGIFLWGIFIGVLCACACWLCVKVIWKIEVD